MRRVRALVIVALISLSIGVLSAQETGFLNRSVLIEGTEYRYQVYVPSEFRRSTSWPIILFLHGGGGGSDGLAPTRNGLAPTIRLHPERFPSIVVFPQRPTGLVWSKPLSEQIALNALDKSIAEFNGDASRIYLTGLSGGGYGAWSLAYDHADRFAALIVLCGYVREMTGVTSGDHYPAIVPDTDPYAAVALTDLATADLDLPWRRRWGRAGRGVAADDGCAQGVRRRRPVHRTRRIRSSYLG